MTTMTVRSLRWLAAVTLAVTPSTLPAQEPQQAVRTGRIVGRILDETTGTPISGAQVGIAMGGQSVSSGIDGRYTLLNVSPGATAIAVRAIGYAPKTVSGVDVPEGGVVAQDITLSAQGVQLNEITVEASAERGSVTRALEEQRSAPNIVNAVTAEQISRSPDSDAAQALQRVSGVTVQDGRYVLVRGLGERYTTTTLNSARLPSPEPERKIVPLDLFPSGLLEAVTTSKTFTPDQSGDFSGAQVDLRTREFDRGRVLAWSVSTGVNSAATGQSIPVGPRTGAEWLGFGASSRAIPAQLQAAGNLSGLTTPEVQGLIGTMRNVWTAHQESGSPQASTSFTLGGEDPVFGQLVSYLGSVSYNYATEVRRDEQRALAQSDGAGGTLPYNSYGGMSGTTSVLWGGIVNLGVRLGAGSRIRFNNSYNRGGDNTATRASGFNEEFARFLDVTRLQYVERSVRTNQLIGEHLLAGRHTISWAANSAGVTRDEPDRSDLAYNARRDTTNSSVTPVDWADITRSANRTYSELSEQSWQFDGAWRWQTGGAGSLALKFGAQYRTTERNADTRSYDRTNLALTSQDLAMEPESLFAQTDKFFMVANANGGRYDASDRLVAGFALAEAPLSRRIRLIGGVRVERSNVTVNTVAPDGTVTPASPEYTDVLPSLAANIELGRDHQLRASVSQTLSRPEYREMSSVCYFEMLGGLTSCGNPALQRALIQNADLRWEWYPRASEIVSIGVFVKHFAQPIERALQPTTNVPLVNYINADGAFNYGVELEIRKNLDHLLGAWALPWSVSLNATLMQSEIDLGDNAFAMTNENRAMMGQSPYVVNAGLGYTSATGRLSASLYYNIVGRRITEAGAGGLQDSYEQPRNIFDASLRYALSQGVAFKLDLKNLADAPYEVRQGSVTRHRYTVGRTVTAGLSWGL